MPRTPALAALTALAAALSAADVAAANVAWGISVNLPGVAVQAGAPAFRVAVVPWAMPVAAPVAVMAPPLPVVAVPAWTVPVSVAAPVAMPLPVVVPRHHRVKVVPYAPIRHAYVPAPWRHPPGPRAVHY